MNDLKQPADQFEREQAILPSLSAIVQAPAGSGKTELLIQRYLALLATVESPEEILAITFTRKAAGEMRERILGALELGEQPNGPPSAHQKKTWQLAREALQRDRENDWAIRENPSRLRVQTIDSLSAGLVRQMPLLSGFGAPPGLTDDPMPLYREAARGLLDELQGSGEISRSIGLLMAHLGNNQQKVEALLVDMLAKRDQWLRHLFENNERESLENGLFNLLEDKLAELSAQIPSSLQATWLNLARFAAENIRAAGKQSALLNCLELDYFPEACAEELPVWQGLIELLLTASGDWRKRFTLKEGFPAPSSEKEPARKQQLKDKKDEVGQLLEQLLDNEPLRQQLEVVRQLPRGYYSEAQWHSLSILFELLPRVVAHLKLVFQAKGEIDFSEMSMRAVLALGDPEAPTDLALRLDYRISHILMDEFQDTSQSQIELLRRLTAGWEQNDGRTLFLVGDPMQSIYRFREAEVGLYLKTQQEGIGEIKLKSLRLKVNFRSQQKLVEWVNESFSQLFPAQNNLAMGAVSYAESVAWNRPEVGSAIEISPFIGRNDLEEAEQLVAKISQIEPNETIAVLVRGKSHLTEIVPKLREAGIRFRAVEIEALSNRSIIQDLLSLTRALLHPADRISWLALLRAPWCGLTLVDMTRLFEARPKELIWSVIQDQTVTDQISADGQLRLARFNRVVEQVIRNRQRQPLRKQVEGSWLALAGPANLTEAIDLEAAELFFELLERLDKSADLIDFAQLETAVEQLFSPPDPLADERLQLMTIHKSKGLEFDHVFLPGLGKRSRSDSKKLLNWLERPREGEVVPDLLLAPIAEEGESDSLITTFIKKAESDKTLLENDRLLYVATTRAKKQLYLFAHAELDKEGEAFKLPPSGSLLARLWPIMASDFKQLLQSMGQQVIQEQLEPEPIRKALSRLSLDWVCPTTPARFIWEKPQEQAELQPESLSFDWAGQAARHVGIVTHAFLERVGNEGGEYWCEEKIIANRSWVKSQLIRSGLAVEGLGEAVEKVETLMVKAIADERGRWLLSSAHSEASCEKVITGLWNGQIKTIIIDRTFIDKEGARWIVDYKTGGHEGADKADFLCNELKRYRPQLACYGGMMAKLAPNPIRLALYYPEMSEWLELSVV
jgi:ATP-dependent exoDNAse (exonuclease V) beta subunit